MNIPHHLKRGVLQPLGSRSSGCAIYIRKTRCGDDVELLTCHITTKITHACVR